ncbi:hypothetical protein [Halovenus halobia]|uniref:hypothetical protein n=1 Tax=Halovenus halobia TaxID=3396622 RepID=UPI003F5736D5
MSEVERVSGQAEGDETTRDGAEMRARRWAIAAVQEPSAYDIPELPTSTVCDCAGLALADAPDSEPFIRAAEPMQVRR